MARRDSDLDDDGALSRRARPTWQVMLLIGTILGAAVSVLAVDRFAAVAAAQEVVRPLERRFDSHLATAEEERAFRELALARLTALCIATPNARCPLGAR